MKNPGHLLDGDRKIPIEQRSRLWMGNRLYELLTNIRRKEGLDPNRYPPVESDIQYDISRTMAGAEITARETADLILPAIRSTKSKGCWTWAILILLSLIVVLGSATTTLAWLTYQQTIVSNERGEIARSQVEYLGSALMRNPKVIVKRDGTDFIIHYKRSLEESLDDSIRIPHRIPPEELERLDQKTSGAWKNLSAYLNQKTP